MSTLESGGWCAPGNFIEDQWPAELLKLSDEELAAYAETLRGGGPCRECEGTGFEHQPCGCPYCEGVENKTCWECGGTGIEPDYSFGYTRETLEQLKAELSKSCVPDLPVMTVKRGGIQWPKMCEVPDCGYIGEAHA